MDPALVYTRDMWEVYPVNTKHLYNICTMLDQSRRRWSNIVVSSSHSEYLTKQTRGAEPMQRFNVGPASSTLSQHWFNAFCLQVTKWIFYESVQITYNMIVYPANKFTQNTEPIYTKNTRRWSNVGLMLAQQPRLLFVGHGSSILPS